MRWTARRWRRTVPRNKLAMGPLHVVSVIYVYEPDVATPEDLLNRYSTVRPWAQALLAEGVKVTVLQRFHRDLRFEDRGISFDFRADMYGPKLRKWQIPLSFHTAVRAACVANRSGTVPATVVHVNGLLFSLQLRALRFALPSSCAIVAQHHAEKPWRKVARPIQKWGLRAADGFLFAARDLASPWVEQGLISRDQKIFEVMEGSTAFRCADRAAARARTSLSGSPVVLWVGRLIALKDPLTVLDGFERILQYVPEARLYMVYGGDDLLPAVRERIASRPLSGAVNLLGALPHAQLEHIYNSSDYFVLGSHYEGSGFSLAEALACGVVPVVTDIPSFRAMTDGGRIGACWAPGNPTAFAEAFLKVTRQPLRQLSEQAVRFFHAQLSYPAIARQSILAYQDVVSARTGNRL
jgi:glycosyltransferase involved in cell wall biosynthesis